MTAPAVPFAPTETQLQHAFTQLRGAGWPATLADLQLDPSALATARLSVLHAAARHVAHGGQITRPDLTGPIVNRPAREPPPRPAPYTPPVRRHSDPGNDRKRAASGDRDE